MGFRSSGLCISDSLVLFNYMTVFFTHMVIPFKFRLCAQVTLCALCRFITLCIQIALLQHNNNNGNNNKNNNNNNNSNNYNNDNDNDDNNNMFIETSCIAYRYKNTGLNKNK